MAIAVVQEPAGLFVNNNTVISLAFASDVTAGNLIVIGCGRYANGADTAFVAGDCTKSAGTATLGTITLDKQINVATTNPVQAGVWSVPVTGTGSLTMQVAGPTGSFFILAIGEYSGVDTSATRVDGSNGSSATTATSPAVTGAVSSTADALFFATLAADSANANLNPVVGNSFTEIFQSVDGTAHMTGEISRRVVASSTNTEGSWTITITNLNGWATALAVYKGESSGAAPIAAYYLNYYRNFVLACKRLFVRLPFIEVFA